MAEQRTIATACRPDGPERRYCPDVVPRIERRDEAAGGPVHIIGHASVFNRWTTIYDGKYFVWREMIAPGAFRNAIGERQNVRSLFNHDDNFLLGTVQAGTLTLREDETGLLADTHAPDTQTIRDLVLTPIARGDITGGSFAFIVRRNAEPKVTTAGGVTVIDLGGEVITVREEGGREIEEHVVKDVDLHDVSPAVTFPAYQQTDVALRTLAERREQSIVQGRGGRRPMLRRAEMRLRLLDAAILSAR